MMAEGITETGSRLVRVSTARLTSRCPLHPFRAVDPVTKPTALPTAGPAMVINPAP
jgi:hypothetical protein